SARASSTARDPNADSSLRSRLVVITPPEQGHPASAAHAPHDVAAAPASHRSAAGHTRASPTPHPSRQATGTPQPASSPHQTQTPPTAGPGYGNVAESAY